MSVMAVAACGGHSSGGGNNDNGSIYCESEDQCPAGWECVSNVCVLQDGGVSPDTSPQIPDITVEPDVVDFGSALLGVSVSETVTIRNDGNGPLTIFSISVEDDGGAGEITAQPTGSLNQVLQPTESVTVTVALTNLDQYANSGRLLISSDDPDEALVQVPLTSELKGNSDIMTCVMQGDDYATNCVDDPEIIDFGTLAFDASGIAMVAITNQGDGNMPLVISDIYVSNSSGHANLFHLNFMEVTQSATGLVNAPVAGFPDEPYLLSTDDGVAPPEVLLVQVRFQAILDGQPVPDEDLVIESNDPVEPSYAIPFAGSILCPVDHYDYDGQPGCEYACSMTNGSVEVCDGVDNNCDGNIDEGVNPGLCLVCDPSGAPVPATDDLNCGSVDCSGWYEHTGTVGATDTDYCYGHEPLTNDRCEGANDCVDANTSDCAGQPRLATPAVSCGICQYVGGCSGDTAGTCENYAPDTPTTLCRGCDGAGNDGPVDDDVNCGTIDCSQWYVRQGTASPTDTDTCHGRESITTNRCEGSGDCKDANTSDCDAQPALATAAVSCGTCQRVAGCLGSIAGYCEDYPAYTPTTLCTECDGLGSGGTRMRADDANCGTIECGGWYSVTGTESTTGTQRCFGHQDITTNRCEGTNDCKDANSSDCSGQPMETTAQATCGLCEHMTGCSGTTAGSCTNYPSGSKTQLCGVCNGHGGEVAATDDDACNTIDCSGWYTKSGTAGVTTVEECYRHVDITSGRCEGLNDCKDANTADCDSQALEAAPYRTCGECKYMAGCVGTTAGSCVPYPDNTPVPHAPCGVGECQADWVCTGGVATCTAGSPTSDEPDPSYLDTNCDGYDGDFSIAILVATTGSDNSSCGLSVSSPCLTINYGIARAVSTGRVHVYIQAGTYDEILNLHGGISLYGGYDTSWARGPRTTASYQVVVNGAYDASVDQYLAAKAIGQSGAIVIADLYLNGPNASGTVSSRGRSSYVVYVRSSEVDLERVTLDAGNGANGSAGPNGSSASQSRPATAGTGGDAREYTTNCDTSRQPGGSGRTNPSCTSNTSGGNGGQGGQMDTSCGWTGFCSNCAATPGLNGYNGDQYISSSVGYRGAGSGTCTMGGGGDGHDGRVTDGGGGGGAGANGYLVSYFWYGHTGSVGALGSNGGGGGGGGGSGGCDSGTDSYGAGGGGGGAGGCRAPSAGGGGYGAGGSFGVFGYAATLTVNDCEFIRGNGGTGGTGGTGGAGQPGGYGGSGGNAAGDSGPGGDGGDGGRGGHSGGGGGGGGGISYGIYSYSSTVSQSGNSFTSGSGGPGGSGGSSPGNYGNAGTGGTVGTVGSCASTGGC